MKKQLDNSTYILLSVGLSLLLSFTAAPYYCVSSIVITDWDIYLSYTTVCMAFLTSAPVLSTLNALITLTKKKKNLEDIFLNIIFPFEILMMLRVCQYSYIAAIAIWGIILGYTFILSKKYVRRMTKHLGYFRRKLFFACRKKIIYLLMFTIFPLHSFKQFSVRNRKVN